MILFSILYFLSLFFHSLNYDVGGFYILLGFEMNSVKIVYFFPLCFTKRSAMTLFGKNGGIVVQAGGRDASSLTHSIRLTRIGRVDGCSRQLCVTNK